MPEAALWLKKHVDLSAWRLHQYLMGWCSAGSDRPIFLNDPSVLFEHLDLQSVTLTAIKIVRQLYLGSCSRVSGFESYLQILEVRLVLLIRIMSFNLGIHIFEQLDAKFWNPRQVIMDLLEYLRNAWPETWLQLWVNNFLHGLASWFSENLDFEST